VATVSAMSITPVPQVKAVSTITPGPQINAVATNLTPVSLANPQINRGRSPSQGIVAVGLNMPTFNTIRPLGSRSPQRPVNNNNISNFTSSSQPLNQMFMNRMSPGAPSPPVASPDTVNTSLDTVDVYGSPGVEVYCGRDRSGLNTTNPNINEISNLDDIAVGSSPEGASPPDNRNGHYSTFNLMPSGSNIALSQTHQPKAIAPIAVTSVSAAVSMTELPRTSPHREAQVVAAFGARYSPNENENDSTNENDDGGDSNVHVDGYRWGDVANELSSSIEKEAGDSEDGESEEGGGEERSGEERIGEEPSAEEASAEVGKPGESGYSADDNSEINQQSDSASGNASVQEASATSSAASCSGENDENEDNENSASALESAGSASSTASVDEASSESRSILPEERADIARSFQLKAKEQLLSQSSGTVNKTETNEKATNDKSKHSSNDNPAHDFKPKARGGASTNSNTDKSSSKGKTPIKTPSKIPLKTPSKSQTPSKSSKEAAKSSGRKKATPKTPGFGLKNDSGAKEDNHTRAKASREGTHANARGNTNATASLANAVLTPPKVSEHVPRLREDMAEGKREQMSSEKPSSRKDLTVPLPNTNSNVPAPSTATATSSPPPAASSGAASTPVPNNVNASDNVAARRTPEKSLLRQGTGSLSRTNSSASSAAGSSAASGKVKLNQRINLQILSARIEYDD
jgi:hypothetical protein